MTASWSNGLKPKPRKRTAASTSPTAQKKSRRKAKSSAVGKGKRLEDGKIVPLDVQPGDRILFGKYSGSEIKLDGEEYMIMREDEVLGILDAQPVRPPKRPASSIHETRRKTISWQNKLFTRKIPARRSCAA